MVGTTLLLWSPRVLGLLVSLFLALFALDAFGIARSHPSWIASISGPPLVVGILFWWSWFRHGELRLAR